MPENTATSLKMFARRAVGAATAAAGTAIMTAQQAAAHDKDGGPNAKDAFCDDAPNSSWRLMVFRLLNTPSQREVVLAVDPTFFPADLDLNGTIAAACPGVQSVPLTDENVVSMCWKEFVRGCENFPFGMKFQMLSTMSEDVAAHLLYPSDRNTSADADPGLLADLQCMSDASSQYCNEDFWTGWDDGARALFVIGNILLFCCLACCATAAFKSRSGYSRLTNTESGVEEIELDDTGSTSGSEVTVDIGSESGSDDGAPTAPPLTPEDSGEESGEKYHNPPAFNPFS